MMKLAKYYTKLSNFFVKCGLCPHLCVIQESMSGMCKQRKNINGQLYSLSYGKPVALNVDPIEKKPLYHFIGGSRSLSVGTCGCNLSCANCQNSSISQVVNYDNNRFELKPKEVVYLAKSEKCLSISYTYNEPTVFYEYMLDTAILAKKNGIYNVMVSNGFICEKPLRNLLSYIDAVNIDIKCFNNQLYKRLTSASLKPSLDSLKIIKEKNVWLEITNLIIPNYTDDLKMISKMCNWLVDNGFSDTPLHFTKFFPSYMLSDYFSTPRVVSEYAYEIAINAGLKYVYLGNIDTSKTNTFCYNCGKSVVCRSDSGFHSKMIDNKCPSCRSLISGVW